MAGGFEFNTLFIVIHEYLFYSIQQTVTVIRDHWHGVDTHSTPKIKFGSELVEPDWHVAKGLLKTTAL